MALHDDAGKKGQCTRYGIKSSNCFTEEIVQLHCTYFQSMAKDFLFVSSFHLCNG